MGNAENAYLFRHAMMRAAAYDLQPPVERSELHTHAYAIIEALPHPDPDAFAYELAGHARDAAVGTPDIARRREMSEREARWLGRAMQRARDNSNFRMALECAERVLNSESVDVATRHGAALLGAEMSAALGEFAHVPEFLTSAEKLHEGGSPTLRAAWILSFVNADLLPKRKYEAGANLLQEALAIFRDNGDLLGEARATGYLGNVLARRDLRKEALVQYEQSEAIFRKLRHQRGLSTCRGNVGLMHRYFGQNDKAESAYREALQIDREIGNREGVPRHLGNLAVLYRETGRFDKALELFDECGDAFRELGDRTGWMRNTINHAHCFEATGQPHRAVVLYQQAERIAEECGLRFDMADCAAYRGEALLKMDDTVRGEPALESAALRYEQLNSPRDAAEVWETLAASAHKREEDAATLRYTTAALLNLEKVKETNPSFDLLALHAEASLAHDQFEAAAVAALQALEKATNSKGLDPIRLATLKAIARKGQASSAT
ncbi:MAG: tetratricopeptide repeat protein [Planctomycetes bacterium]|nr:tetratricopeptide repeat protein [Planctomycetota bacterium]